MGILIPIILGLVPSFVWLLFYLHEDYRHPEPRKLIFYTFLAGIFITIFVLQFQIWINRWLSAYGIDIYSGLSFLFLAAIEEFFKFLAVFLIMRDRQELDEPVDAMIYMVVAALGFSAVENVASAIRSLEAVGAGPLETTSLRFVGATVLHTLSSGVVGYYWGLSMIGRMSFTKAIGVGLVTATLLHTFFNYLIIRFEEVTIPIIFLLIVGLVILGDFEKLKKIGNKM